MTVAKEYRLEGARVHGIGDLYDEFNRLLMADRDWRLGATLDGLNDVLHDVRGPEDVPARFVWIDHAHSREALGVAETERWLRDKLERGGFDEALIQRRLDDLLAGRGKTYFDLVLEVFADHPQIDLRLR